MTVEPPMQPFCDGYAAGLRGVGDPRCCPHDKMTKEWNEWNRGHGLGCGVVIDLQAGSVER